MKLSEDNGLSVMVCQLYGQPVELYYAPALFTVTIYVPAEKSEKLPALKAAVSDYISRHMLQDAYAKINYIS